MTLVKTFTATSSKVHEPIMDCCTSNTQQQTRFLKNRNKHMAFKKTDSYFCARTIENIVPRVHLTELGHVLDRVTTGRGGAYAGLTGDASSLQSEVIQHFGILVH